MMATTRLGSRTASGRSSTPFTTEKIAVLAPMPIASVATAIVANDAFLRSARAAYRMSCRRDSIIDVSSEYGSWYDAIMRCRRRQFRRARHAAARSRAAIDVRPGSSRASARAAPKDPPVRRASASSSS